jgi:hypothetical protein
MRERQRYVHALLAAAIGVVAAAALGFPAAAGASSPAESATGNFYSGPFHIVFSAQRPAGAPASAASGSFTGQLTLGPIVVGYFQGPVTCLDVVGNRVGLFYPITSSSPPLANVLVRGVFVTAQVSASGRAKAVTFIPMLSARVNSCAPAAALLPITSGSLTLTP